ncbi:unnamed protein product [Lactuca saligna]|uniref:Uncharacterized protein n=1 Tax=Lactuca saligna TaxID=75948 RepID=A0AA35ZWE4_LACSI|nr:unnamed protein product [Lactuca saligna]
MYDSPRSHLGSEVGKKGKYSHMVLTVSMFWQLIPIFDLGTLNNKSPSILRSSGRYSKNIDCRSIVITNIISTQRGWMDGCKARQPFRESSKSCDKVQILKNLVKSICRKSKPICSVQVSRLNLLHLEQELEQTKAQVALLSGLFNANHLGIIGAANSGSGSKFTKLHEVWGKCSARLLFYRAKWWEGVPSGTSMCALRSMV